MLTIRFDELGLRPGDSVLDVGAGFGRHVFECARRGANVVALDYAEDEVVQTRATLGGMVDAGEIPIERFKGVLRGDATRLPFADDSFDVVITSEVLEHIQNDVAAIAEMVRVLKPGGTFAGTVPAWFPEKINWMLSDEYHAPIAEGGHVRIYSATELAAKLRAAGLDLRGHHRAHALHSPYWWLKCAVGPRNDAHPLVVKYREFLEWDIMKQPTSTRIADRVLSPAIGKSIVFYGVEAPGRRRERAARARRRRVGRRGPSHGDAPRVAPVADRDDPVVRGRTLRPVEPRRVGDGARRGRALSRGRAGLRVARRHAAPDGWLVRLLRQRRIDRGRQDRHQRVRLHRRRRVPPLPQHLGPRLRREPVAGGRTGARVRPVDAPQRRCAVVGGRDRRASRGTTPC